MPSLLRTVCLALACTLVVPYSWAADPAPAPAPAAAPATLVGLTRDDVIAVHGKPSGERTRGDTVLMVYPDGMRIELREGRVISVSGVTAATGGEIVGADGTRYVPGADGNIQRPVEIIEAGTRTAATGAPESDGADTPAEDAEDADADLPPGGTAPPSVDAARAAAQAAVAEDLAEYEEDESADELSPGMKLVAGIVGAVLHFGLTVLVLWIAIRMVGVPYFWPDLLKVAGLYVAVHGALTSLAELGGYWEFITLFRAQEVVSFLVLACSLTWFKIAGNGITALKIAAGTKVALVALMLGVGLVIAIGLGLLMG